MGRSLLDRYRDRAAERSLTLSDYVELLNYAGNQYALTGTGTGMLYGSKRAPIEPTLSAFAEHVLKANPIIWGCIQARMAVFAEARLKFRRMVAGRPGAIYGTPALGPLEEPWPGATTGKLLRSMLLDVDLAGNWFAWFDQNAIRRLRPDWVTIILGGEGYGDPRAEIAGYAYTPGGPSSGAKTITFLPDEIVHWAPTPDPLFPYRGLSWITPVLRDISADRAATEHKDAYLSEGAVPNMVVTADPGLDRDRFQEFVELFKAQHSGVEQAFKTIFLGGGSKADVVGANLRQTDFKAIQAIGENRICIAARVPAIIAGASEGLASATYSNFGQARRAFTDGTISPLWRDACEALEPAVNVPGGSHLWYDSRDIPYLQEDAKDESEIQSKQAATVSTYVAAGFTPESSVDAVASGDLSRLVHSGLVSVQLLPPGEASHDEGGAEGEQDTAGDTEPESEAENTGDPTTNGKTPSGVAGT